MNFEFFIARRVATAGGRTYSRFIIRLAIAAVALSLAVMIVAVSSVKGFRKEISEKMFGFWGHIQIRHLTAAESYEDPGISMNQPFYPHLDTMEGVRHIQAYARKAGIVRANDQLEGIVLKGVGRDFDWPSFSRFMKSGKILSMEDTVASGGIIISAQTAARLKLMTSDPLLVYFIQNPPRVRKFSVTGIYSTGLTEYDRKFALVDIRHIRKLNDWEDDQAGGFEVFIDDPGMAEKLADHIHRKVIDHTLAASSITEENPMIFDWLKLQGRNEKVILVLMLLVGGINMITALLVLIMERTGMIGILKALGSTGASIQKVFLYHAVYILAAGMLLGNILGTGLVLAQEKFGLVKLSEESYYLSVVPVELGFMPVLLLNALTFVLSILMLIIPSFLVSGISPLRAIRWE